MYFESRWQAGELLARELYDRYRYEDCVVVALSDGGAVVGEQVASWLHTALTLLVTEDIDIPGENMTFGTVSEDGELTYNADFSSGEIDEYTSEFHGYLDEQKRVAFQKINRMIGNGGTIDLDLIVDRNVILVSDGLQDSTIIGAAIELLKPIRIKRLIVAAPVATVGVVDTIHMLADEIHILDVKQNYLGTDHYYNDNRIPDRQEVVKTVNSMLLRWK